jgi:hypothetical protein
VSSKNGVQATLPNPRKAGAATALVEGGKIHISSCPDFHKLPSALKGAVFAPGRNPILVPGSCQELQVNWNPVSSFQGFMV